MKLHPIRRIAGILEPVFAIRTENDLGIGDTDGVRQMIKWCRRHGLHLFQTLPINETGKDNSPYNAISSLAIDPTTIAISPATIPDLSHAEFERIASANVVRSLRKGPVVYERVKKLKGRLLEAAFASFYTKHFVKQTGRDRRFRKFIVEHRDWLVDYALFRALMEWNGNSEAWEKWISEHQTPGAALSWLAGRSKKVKEQFFLRQLFFAYAQWIAFAQWEDVKRFAERNKVWLMGDIPYGVARNSADVWANRELFDLEWSGGAPAEKFFRSDPFTAKWGQNWSIPNYRWDVMRARNYHWWSRRVGNVRHAFHLCRIDHAIGFYRIYSFPWTPDKNKKFAALDRKQAAALTGGKLPGFKPFADDSPAHRKANLRHGEEIFRALRKAAGTMALIAEDLGMVPEYMPGSLRKLKIPGFRIPCFCRAQDGSYEPPRQYPRLSLAQPATHDHPPQAAAWEDLQANVKKNAKEMRHWMKFAGLAKLEPPREYSDELREGTLRAVLEANSWLAVIMITDVFGLSFRFNTPGSAGEANWSARFPLTASELGSNPAFRGKTKRFARLIRETGRS